jgi:hypothetical protein
LPVSGQAVDGTKKTLQSERSRSYDAIQVLIKIQLDLDSRAFDGATTVTRASLREGLDACVLDPEDFTVTGVVGNNGRPRRCRPSGTWSEGRPKTPWVSSRKNGARSLPAPSGDNRRSRA